MGAGAIVMLRCCVLNIALRRPPGKYDWARITPSRLLYEPDPPQAPPSGVFRLRPRAE